jgi:predicted phage terminase large subunit-like protein
MNANEAQADKHALLHAARRLLALRDAKNNLLPFMRLTMPDPNALDDVTQSLYVTTPQARLLCEIIEKVERGELKRVAISISPQTGKSQVLTRGGPAWISGRDPRRHVMVGAYNQDFANEFGDDVRQLINSSGYKQVFPDYKLDKGGQAKDLLITKERGKLAFVGVGGSGTGKPADFFFVDDPIRNDEDAMSAAYRDKIWKWFNRVVFTRCHGGTPIVVVHTRWHEDDLIGRLCDPDHPGRRRPVSDGGYAGIESRWEYFNIPAVVTDPELAAALKLELHVPTDPIVVHEFGSRPMASLWEEKFPLTFLAEAKHNDPVGFSALRMGKPTPDDGAYFRAEDIVEYDVSELPTTLRKYGASDHAVSKSQGRDYTVLGCIGVDENNDIWVLPDLIWDRMETDKTVEEMLIQFKTHKPLLWWMESELISKSFGPFLFKRMHEERIYTSIDEVTPSKDKPLRARSIQGRMRMRKVRFPRRAPWWPNARAQMLRFPNGTNDDFCDWLAHIGMGLNKEIRPQLRVVPADKHASGSIQWILAQTQARARHGDRLKARGW